MKSIEFCYWLQGLFELAEPIELTTKQTYLIKEHLKLVFEHDKQPMLFCSFLNGYLTVCNPTEIPKKETALIIKQLNLVFDHVVTAMPQTSPTIIKGQEDLKPKIQSFC